MNLMCNYKYVNIDNDEQHLKGILNGKGKVYQHFKGNKYIILDIATNSETMEKMVIYRALYEDNKLWVRPLDMFSSQISDERKKEYAFDYRFQEIEIKKI